MDIEFTEDGDAPHLLSLAEALTPVRELYGHLLDAAAAWQADRARRVELDTLALICVAVDSGFDLETTPTRWTRTAVYHVLRCDIPNWCSMHRCVWPQELPEAMWDWFDFLADSGRLDPASDPVAELRKPLLCYGGLDERGCPRPEGVPRPVECECHLPYRETAQLLNELAMQCEWRGEDPVDVLRRVVGRGP